MACKNGFPLQQNGDSLKTTRDSTTLVLKSYIPTQTNDQTLSFAIEKHEKSGFLLSKHGFRPKFMVLLQDDSKPFFFVLLLLGPGWSENSWDLEKVNILFHYIIRPFCATENSWNIIFSLLFFHYIIPPGEEIPENILHR